MEEQTRRPGKTAGLVFLFGYFLLFCALVSGLDAGWRAYREHRVATGWIETTAQVQKCLLDLHYPFARNGGGTIYSLRCRLGYEFESHHYDYELRTVSERPEHFRQRIRAWVARHRPGSILTVRVNPSDPGELLVESDLPVEQFRTARDGGLTALAFGAAGCLLVAIGRRLAQARLRSSAPA